MNIKYMIKKNILKQKVTPGLVLSEIDKLARKQSVTLFEVIDAVRAAWIDKLPSKLNLSKEERKRIVTKEELIKKCEAIGVEMPKFNSKLLQLASSYGMTAEAWRNDENFVFKYRLHLPIRGVYEPHFAPNYDLFFRLFGDIYKGKKAEMMKILESFDLSIRPLNFCSSIAKSEAIRNFIPVVGQKFQKDPFGVQRREHLVLDKERGKSIYLATRKVGHGTYLAILENVAYCTAGCAKCYRGEQTRELKKFKIINEDNTEEIIYFVSPGEQIERLVRKWNEENNPPDDILFSGGEPLDVSFSEWIKVFEALKKAKYLKFFRICTGDLFLGKPFRLINNKFLEYFRLFYEQTGIAVKFAVNLPHTAFITPESVYTILTLHKLDMGVEIQTQTPLEENILCFQNDIQKRIDKFGANKLSDKEMIDAWSPSLARSFKLLHDLCLKISMLADRPYKFIHDMQQSVSIIYTTVLYSLLSEPHVETTDAAIRPTSFAVFTPHLPNLNMGFHSLQYIANVKGAYETDKKRVTFKIPHAVGGLVKYEEPYWRGINDEKTIKRIADIDFWKKLREKVMSDIKKI